MTLSTRKALLQNKKYKGEVGKYKLSANMEKLNLKRFKMEILKKGRKISSKPYITGDCGFNFVRQ